MENNSFSNNTLPVQSASFTRQNSFKIVSIEEMQANGWKKDNSFSGHSYSLIWIVKGSGYYLAEHEKKQIDTNTVYCISNSLFHLIQPDDNCEGYVISFNDEFINLKENNFDLLFNSGLFCGTPYANVVQINPSLTIEMHDVISKIVTEEKSGYLMKSEMVKGLLKILLVYLCRQVQSGHHFGERVKNMEVLRKFNALIEGEFTARLNVSEYAARLHISPGYLNTIVKEASGFPVRHHIQQRVILEAKRKALSGDSSMKEIAYNLGFNCTSHFSKFFKNVSGFNFTSFKREMNVVA